MSKSNEPATTYAKDVGSEIRGDKILVSGRKFNKAELVRRSGQHHATEMIVEKDARARILRSYTNQKQG